MTNKEKKITIGLNGLILAGGRSARMGHDKSVIQYHAVAQRQHLFSILENFCDVVFTSCKIIDNLPAALNPLPDRYEFDSPLNGILTAFKHNSSVAWITVPVDMPLIDSKTIDYLLSHRDPLKIATCFFDSDGKKPEPLFTIWEQKSYALILNYYNAGNISPRNFLMQEKINVIEIPDPKILLNINDPEALEKFKSGDHNS